MLLMCTGRDSGRCFYLASRLVAKSARTTLLSARFRLRCGAIDRVIIALLDVPWLRVVLIHANTLSPKGNPNDVVAKK